MPSRSSFAFLMLTGHCSAFCQQPRPNQHLTSRVRRSSVPYVSIVLSADGGLHVAHSNNDHHGLIQCWAPQDAGRIVNSHHCQTLPVGQQSRLPFRPYITSCPSQSFAQMMIDIGPDNNIDAVPDGLKPPITPHLGKRTCPEPSGLNEVPIIAWFRVRMPNGPCIGRCPSKLCIQAI